MGPRSDVRLQTIVLIVSVLLTAVKFAAWRVTHSNAVLSDAFESIVNVVAGVFALYALMLAAKPRDREHPYGHGKIEFISAGIEGSLIVIASLVIIVRATFALVDGNEVHEVGLGLMLGGIAGGLNLAMGLVLKKRGRAQRSLTMEASGTHLLSDAWSTLAMLAGLVTIALTDIQWLDGLFAIGFGLLILVQGISVVRKAVAGIMDETDMSAAADVVSVLEQHRRPQWVDLHNFRVIQFGRTLHIDCHVTLPWYYSLERAHEEIATMELLVNDKGDRHVELFIHMDPCVPSSCSICSLADCAQRQTAHVSRVAWDLQTVLGNAKHGTA